MNSICTNNIFQISDFLTDHDSVNLFSVNKSFQTIFETHADLYTIKKLFYDSDILYAKKLYPYLSDDSVDRFKRFRYSNLYWTSDNFDEESHFINLKSLKTIHFSSYFNKSVDNLPNKLQKITFGLYFDQPIDHLPKGLKYLELGGTFNQPIDYLPEGLECLKVDGVDFNQPINHLPKSLVRLDLGDSFNHPVDNLPEGLKILHISSDYTHKIDNLPSTLTHLILDGDFNLPIDRLPKGLLYLHLGMNFDKKLDKLPKSLRTLILENSGLDTSKVHRQCKIYDDYEEIEDFITNDMIDLYSNYL